MKGITILVLNILLCANILTAQLRILHPVDQGSAVGFIIRNFGIAVDGSFSGLEGEIRFDPAAPLSSSFNVTVKAASINTGNASRDRHLRTGDFFDVENYPLIRVAGEKVKAGTEKDQYLLQARIDMHGKTGQVDIPFTVKSSGNSWLFEGSFVVNRRHYQVGGSSWSMADNATVHLKILAQ